MEVAEFPRVACDGSRGVAGERASPSPQERSVAGQAAFPGPLETAAPDGQAPGPSPALPQLPGSGGAASSEHCTWPSFNPAAVSAAEPAEMDDLPGLDPPPEEGPPPFDLGRPSSRLGLTGGRGEGAVSDGQGEGGDRSPEVVFSLEKEPLKNEGRASCPESDSESDSDTDSSSSVSSSSSCSPVLSQEDEGQYKNDENAHMGGKKDELSESLPVEELTIFLPESVELLPFGKVSGIIENLVIVESLKGLPPVNEDSVLFKQDHYSLGKVFEVFGPVSHPFYAVQFKSAEYIETKGIKVHDAVYFAPSVESFTQYIFPEKIKQDKGSDASWKNDEEPPPEALDFSDDEKEKVAKQQKKSQNLRRKKFRSQDESNENGIHYQSRRHYPSNYSSGSLWGEQNVCFSGGRFPHSPVSPRSYRQQLKPSQHYSPDYTAFQKPSRFCQPQRKGSSGRQQYSFPPPSFGTVSNEANPFSLPPPTWGWAHGCTQNTYDPLLSLLSLPPPPPPPLPPPLATPSGNTNCP